nr:MAG TPA: hypothetical protein [Caudoviricetes sp.]
MGRLIDEDELIKDRVENDLVVIAAKCTPTAYDPDKVVEQLEDRKSLMLETFKISESDIDRGRIYGIDKAIEIVKGGGVDA